jgi:iron complex outermembrane receptor protein
MKAIFRTTALLPLLLVTAVPTTTMAQDSDFILEEVIVTAQKREQSLQDVPVAVSAFTGQQIQDAEIHDIRSLQLLSTSLNVTQAAAAYQTSISIRGIGTSGFNPGLEPSVGVFVDGVYRSRTGTSIGDYNEVERIEILRGPQSTLYGKNSSAGVIGYHTKKPEYEFNGEASLNIGNYSQVIANARVTGPLIEDKLAFSLAATYNERDGFIKNPTQKLTANDRDRWGLRGQLLWDAGDTV